LGDKQQWYIFVGLLVVLAAVVAFSLRGGKKEKPPPNVPGYYTGPMRNKADPTKYTTEDNRVVPPPPGASTSPSWTPVPTGKAGPVKESQ